ncbi:hypothetical protein L9F63_024660, partial [Diploptera punctata]
MSGRSLADVRPKSGRSPAQVWPEVRTKSDRSQAEVRPKSGRSLPEVWRKSGGSLAEVLRKSGRKSDQDGRGVERVHREEGVRAEDVGRKTSCGKVAKDIRRNQKRSGGRRRDRAEDLREEVIDVGRKTSGAEPYGKLATSATGTGTDSDVMEEAGGCAGESDNSNWTTLNSLVDSIKFLFSAYDLKISDEVQLKSGGSLTGNLAEVWTSSGRSLTEVWPKSERSPAEVRPKSGRSPKKSDRSQAEVLPNRAGVGRKSGGSRAGDERVSGGSREVAGRKTGGSRAGVRWESGRSREEVGRKSGRSRAEDVGRRTSEEDIGRISREEDVGSKTSGGRRREEDVGKSGRSPAQVWFEVRTKSDRIWRKSGRSFGGSLAEVGSRGRLREEHVGRNTIGRRRED